jgi:hypothetical protein
MFTIYFIMTFSLHIEKTKASKSSLFTEIKKIIGAQSN